GDRTHFAEGRKFKAAGEIGVNLQLFRGIPTKADLRREVGVVAPIAVVAGENPLVHPMLVAGGGAGDQGESMVKRQLVFSERVEVSGNRVSGGEQGAARAQHVHVVGGVGGAA